MKNCELCKGLARMYCESDNASLCWDCDAKVHSANFLAARHSRSLLCHVCQSPTAWSADGPKLGPTVSVCERCVDGYYHREEVEESESVNDEGSATEDEDDEDEDDEDEDDEEIDDEDEIDSEDIDQVVPGSSTPPPPPASSSSSEDSSEGRRNVTLKRRRENDADLHSDDDSGRSLCHRRIHTTPSAAVHGGDEVAAVVVSTKMRTPAKIQRTEASRADRLTAPGCTGIMEYIRSVGVIYGDLGTSPLYTIQSTFTEKIGDKNDILGVLSLIIYTIFLVPMTKYVFTVLWANDNGNGGAFVLYSLICRHANVSLIPNQEPEDRELSRYGLDIPSNQFRRAQKIRHKLENTKFARFFLVFLAILGTSMVIGDGIITPSISVLSAVSGIKPLGQEAIVGVSVAILVALFCFQRFGTDKVGYSFAPAICIWFCLISGTGMYNLFKHDVSVLRAFNPIYIFDYFKGNGKKGWLSLGGVILCITGSEAMFVDLGHFSVRSVQISFSCVVFPSILSAYIGQAAYLTKFPENVGNAFYASVLDPIYWPTFVVAVVAAIIASQAMISGAFSIVAQAQSLGCFPRVKVIHTSAKHEGQVYIPELNYFLMVACVVVTLSFKTTRNLGNAYGICVVSAELTTTNMMTLVMLLIWKISIWRIILFYVVYVTIESTYLSTQLTKFVQGGFLPLAFSFVLVIIMGNWHYVQKHRYEFELKNKVSSDYCEHVIFVLRDNRSKRNKK